MAKVNPFAEVNQFLSTIELTPEQKAARKREAIMEKIATPDGVWLSTAQSRQAFRSLSPAAQLYAAFGDMPGVCEEELAALCRAAVK